MNLQFYLEKLTKSNEFKKFKKENLSAYFCSGFFSIDKKGNDNQQHLDFFVKDTGKAFSFQMEKGINLVELEYYKDSPGKLNEKIDFDFNKIEEKIINKMQEEKIKNEMQKLLFSLQNIDRKDTLIGTIFISGLGLIKTRIDLKTSEIIEFERKSFFEFFKIIKR